MFVYAIIYIYIISYHDGNCVSWAMHFSECDSRGHRGKAGEGKRKKKNKKKENSSGGPVFMEETWPQAGHRPDWGKKWQKEKSKEMAKLEVCRVFWGRQVVCGFHSKEGQNQVPKTPVFCVCKHRGAPRLD